MKRSNWIVVGIAIFLSLSLGCGVDQSSQSNAAQKKPSTVKEVPQKILYYRNPMGADDTSPVPKKDSMGMDYIPVYETADKSPVNGDSK